MSQYYLVRVRDAYGTYTTSTVCGFRASCTAGARQAVERLGQKLYGKKAALRIEQDDALKGLGLYRLYRPEAK